LEETFLPNDSVRIKHDWVEIVILKPFITFVAWKESVITKSIILYVITYAAGLVPVSSTL